MPIILENHHEIYIIFYDAIKTQERALISKKDDLEMTEILL